MIGAKPPDWPGLLLRYLYSSRYIEEIEGDLREYYERDISSHSRWRANWNYLGNVIKFLVQAPPNEEPARPNYGNAIHSGLLTAMRNARRHKVFSLLNITGLVLGITACLFLLTYVIDELSYDRYHRNVERIYRVTDGVKFDEDLSESAIIPSGWSYGFSRNLPEIEAVGRINQANRFTPTISYQNRIFRETNFIYMDSALLNIFDFHYVYKKPGNPLHQPNGLIVTREMALKYFGDRNPLGETLLIDNERRLEVTAVIDMPQNTSFPFDFAALLELEESDLRVWAQTFILLKPGVNPGQLEEKLATYVTQNYGDRPYAPRQGMSPRLQPISAIHHYSDLKFEYAPNSDIAYIYLFSSLGAVILFISVLNFINLFTAHAAVRLKEVHIRKIVGAVKSQITLQFLIEGILYMITALGMATLLARVLAPLLDRVAGRSIDVFSILTGPMWFGIVVTSILIGMVASLYPAIFLSSLSFFNDQWRHQNVRIRSSLVVLQFTLSTLMISGAIVIQRQLELFQSQELGFNNESKLILRINDDNLREGHRTVREEILKLPGVREVSFTQTYPGERTKMAVLVYKAEQQQETTIIPTFLTDLHFAQSLDIPLLSGRYLDPSRPDDQNNCLINAETAELMGWTPETALGQEMHAIDLNLKGKVVGVTGNFNYASLHNAIEPVVIFPVLQYPMAFHAAIVNLENDALTILPALKEVLKSFSADTPFEYSLLNDDLTRLYSQDLVKSSLFNVFVLLSIIIACVGLFGLTLFSLDRRTKEICIRKVLGSSMFHLIGLLTFKFLKLVFIANLIAVPLGAWLSHQWLQDFAYRVELSPDIFVLGIFISSGLALGTIITLTIRKSMINAADQLRHE